MTSSARDHAVVIGASFAGIVTARVLSDHFAQVTVIERDQLPEGPELRKGVPQGGHVHGIMQLGREILDDLFPGFVAETQQEGAVIFDQIALGMGWGKHGWSSIFEPSSLRGYGVRRPLLEYVARRRALALDNVTLVSGRVDGLTVGEGRRITGVLLGGDAAGDAPTPLEADLVVEASGRGSAAPGWLEAAGFEAPTETQVNAFGGYASRLLRVPDEIWPEGVRFVAQLPLPGCTKGAIVYPQDNGLHIVSLFGVSHDYPPRDEAGFDEFLRNCAVPLMHEIVSKSEPVSEIRTSRSTVNRWRHYEKIANPPAGFVVVGDANAAFNPMYGQGISSACLGAVTLGKAISDAGDDLADLPHDFQTRLAALLVVPWFTAINYDLQFPETVGERPAPTEESKKRGAYMDVLAQLATEDLEVAEAFLRAVQTFDPSALDQPSFPAKAAQWIADGRKPRFTDPNKPPVAAAA
jgi:2-polyprenyl-6-methoxyphenol hydroxylase-like FAD-dependent oxidoreductase